MSSKPMLKADYTHRIHLDCSLTYLSATHNLGQVKRIQNRAQSETVAITEEEEKLRKSLEFRHMVGAMREGNLLCRKCMHACIICLFTCLYA